MRHVRVRPQWYDVCALLTSIRSRRGAAVFAAREHGIERIPRPATTRPVFLTAIGTYPVVFRGNVAAALRTVDHHLAPEPRIIDEADADQYRRHPCPKAEALPGEDVHGRETVTEVVGVRPRERLPCDESYQRSDQQRDGAPPHERDAVARGVGRRVVRARGGPACGGGGRGPPGGAAGRGGAARRG